MDKSVLAKYMCISPQVKGTLGFCTVHHCSLQKHKKVSRHEHPSFEIALVHILGLLQWSNCACKIRFNRQVIGGVVLVST